MNNEDGDSDSDDSEACLQDLLGGIDFQQDWNEDDEDPSGVEVKNKVTPGLVDPSSLSLKEHRPIVVPSTTMTSVTTSRSTINAQQLDDDEDAILFQNAFTCSGYYCTDQHNVQRPPLQIVSLPNRGNGLVATRDVAKGEVIYTERAAVATQVVSASKKQPAPVSACKYCFRSLESWTKLLHVRNDDNTLSTSQSTTPSPPTSIPYPELWPVLPLTWEDEHISGPMRKDKFGRIQCLTCDSLFCCQACREQQHAHFGSCCVVRRLLDHLSNPLGDVDVDDDDDQDQDPTVQAPIAVGAVLFLQLIQYYRKHNQSLHNHWIHRMCGTSKDLQELELGKPVQQQEDGTLKYTLRPMYDYMMEELLDKDNDKENIKTILSLELLESLVSKAARNGVSFTTQSPFKAYYAGLLRKTNYGGRQSEVHQLHMEQLVAALGKETLYRSMDRDLDALVAPEITALFPLTSQCNHSCDPNAQLQSQEFVDAHIDVVALRDITMGEEVCISYVGRRSNRFQRRKDLKSRYLFDCHCSRCSKEARER